MKTLVPAPDESEEIGGIDQEPYPRIGILERFQKDDYLHVENTIKDLKSIRVKELKTNISFSDYNSEGGEKWYDWLFPKMTESCKVLPCLDFNFNHYTQKEYILSSDIPHLFSGFIDTILNRYGQYFEYIELQLDGINSNHSSHFSKEVFHQLILDFSVKAHEKGKKTILGFRSSYPFWDETVINQDLFSSFDAIGISAFPGVYDLQWKGWLIEIDKIENILNNIGSAAEIWITETGYSTWRSDDQKQIIKFLEAFKSPVNKIYWHSLYDLSPNYSSWNGFHQDERDYHFGIKKFNGMPKFLFRLLSAGKPSEIEKEPFLSMTSHFQKGNKKGILITGGAGFIGTNLAYRLLSEGKRVIIYDNLSRPGVENNLKWLLSSYPELEVIIADVTNYYSLQKAVNEAEHIFHFAAQVAVTSSLQLPIHDFEVNAGGTLNVLEAIRNSKHKPSLVFTSTNKVYGDLSNLELKSDKKRYFPVNKEYYRNGINESFPLNFLSPYGNSKGCADQYVLDYARSFGLRNVVFRMSCIYGPHQFGTEDQGWIAHFLNQSIKEHTITIYGDGKQVRDVLYVEDLVEAFLIAMKNINELPGQAFNIGGGPSNAISLLDLISYMHKLDHLKIQVIHDIWRTGDQKYYVTDTRKFRERTGWQPKVSYPEGISNIFAWLFDYYLFQNQKTMVLK